MLRTSCRARRFPWSARCVRSPARGLTTRAILRLESVFRCAAWARAPRSAYGACRSCSTAFPSPCRMAKPCWTSWSPRCCGGRNCCVARRRCFGETGRAPCFFSPPTTSPKRSAFARRRLPVRLVSGGCWSKGRRRLARMLCNFTPRIIARRGTGPGPRGFAAARVPLSGFAPAPPRIFACWARWPCRIPNIPVL